MKFYLYSLVRRAESVPFYIGVTTRWDRRFPQHKLKFGRDIIGTVIAQFDREPEAIFAETGAIKYWISQGVSLENRGCQTKGPEYGSEEWNHRRAATRQHLVWHLKGLGRGCGRVNHW